MESESSFERVGGEDAVRGVINDFMDRVFDDVMIGFHFRGASRPRIKELEYQLAAKFLGAPVEYKGKPLFEAHAKHRILGGHFMRRMKILKDTLEAHHIPEDIKAEWIAHNEVLRSEITGDKGSGCDHDLAEARRRVAERSS